MSKMLLTITGPSGCGKTSVLKELMRSYGVSRVVTCTTREPRPGEKDGVDYHFLNGGEHYLFAITEFAGNIYGISFVEMMKQFRCNDVLAVVVDNRGAKDIWKRFADNDDITVHNVYININPKRALSHMAHRDGWSKAKKRQKADFEEGLYYDKYFEIAQNFDCIISNDRTNTIKNMARDIMNYVEAQKWTEMMMEKAS